MATYYWAGHTGPTGQEWGITAHWLTDQNVPTSFPAKHPFGGDTVIFGATAKAACLFGGLTAGGYWAGYTGNVGDTYWTGDITVIIEPRYGGTFPNEFATIGYSFGSSTGGLDLKVNKLFIGLTFENAEICINNKPSSSYSFAHMNGQTATFYASGSWTTILVEKGSFKSQNLTAKAILVDGIQPRNATERTYFTGTPGVSYAGFGVDEVQINSPSNIDSLIFTAKATAKQSVVNGTIKSPIVNAMGVTGPGYTYTSVVQNVRPAGFAKQFNRITRTSRYYRG